MSRIKLNEEFVNCYSCGKQQYEMRGFVTPENTIVAYCRTCIFQNKHTNSKTKTN